jgi:hypothetical protein
MNRLVGMAENIIISDKILSVEKFEAGWKALQEAIQEGKITAENAIDFFDEARIYFNHKIIVNSQGNKLVVQIADHNCVEVVKVVDEFFKTGKINSASFSQAQDMWIDLSVWFQNKYNLPKGLISIDNVGVLHTTMIDNETGILLCMRGGLDDHHVINVIKRKGSKFASFEYCQSISNIINLKKIL